MDIQERDDIIIKPADKGSAVVVMDKTTYLDHSTTSTPYIYIYIYFVPYLLITSFLIAHLWSTDTVVKSLFYRK
jgi:hypothetical protein